MNDSSIISAKDLSIGYKKSSRIEYLHQNISFDLNMGEMVSLIGVNGSGKSTLLRTISGSQKILSGSLFLNGKSFKEYKPKEVSQFLGLVLTDKTSVGGFSVKELVELGRYPYSGFFGQLTKADNFIVAQAMDAVGISHKANNFVAELSDGERQKAMIAKALAQECPIMMLDEPTAFLDVESKIEIMMLLHKLAHENKKAILLSTHDIDIALKLSDKLWLLSQNEGFRAGTTEDIILSEKMNNFFKSPNIEFNPQLGSYIPKSSHQKFVCLTSSGVLKYWATNFLKRNGFEVIDDNNHVNENSYSFHLQVHTSDEFIIKYGNTTLHFSSFDQLQNWVNNNN